MIKLPITTATAAAVIANYRDVKAVIDDVRCLGLQEYLIILPRFSL